MQELAVDASKFAGMSEEQARTFPRRTVVGVELSGEQAIDFMACLSSPFTT